MADKEWPPRFTMTPEAAARLILLNYQQEQNEAKTVLAIEMLVNSAYQKGIEVGQQRPSETVAGEP